MWVFLCRTTYRGDFERRMEEIVKEAKENQSVILFIDELHTLMELEIASMVLTVPIF